MSTRSGNVFASGAQRRRRAHRRGTVRDAVLLDTLVRAVECPLADELPAAVAQPAAAVDGRTTAAARASPWSDAVIARLAHDPALRLELRRGLISFEYGD